MPSTDPLKARVEPTTEPPKRCPKCQTVKPASEFHRDKAKTSGRGSYCMACHRLVVLASYQRNREDPAYRAKLNTQQQRYAARYPEKIRARTAVTLAIKRGELTRPTECPKCGIKCTPEASHHDYSRPLDIEWLCRRCHAWKDRPTRGQPSD